MRKIRFSLLAAAAVITNISFAQTVEQGKKFLYYERYKSAQDAFEKVLAANPNNIDAVYWLGQTMVHRKDTRDTAGAKALYQKMLATNGSAPLLLAGMGHIELMQGNTADAKQRFETAISLTKAKDINVLNAVGYANTDAKAGDANYAIEKLNLATQTKNFNNAQTYIYLGDAYRKLIDGGNAVTNYTKALGADPKLAEAKFKIGMIYYTQNNKDYFLPAFEDAIQIDPAYAPAYYQLFYYWYFRDVNKAATYLDKYVANADQGPEVEYLKTDFLYASGKNAEAKTKAQELISQYGDKVSPRMYRMVAYTADTLGDIQAAKQAITTFFTKADTSIIMGTDYEALAKINSKMPDSATKNEAFKYFGMAIARDTLPENKAKYANEGIELAKKLGNKAAAADLAAALYKTKKDPSNADLYNLGMANYQAGNYKNAGTIFCEQYESKYPNEIFGYLWCARSLQAQDDSLNSKGLAVDAYEKLVQMGRTLPDSAKYKTQVVQGLFYLASYYNDVKKDKPKAVTYMQKVLEVDPSNASAPKIIEALTKPPKQAATKPKSGTK
ncbi:MAG: tetratricopeptide repeat protein [Bacteroidetes bacterium]|nr:tetratricopeptide repeat protein [Bacteroidota bacterium]